MNILAMVADYDQVTIFRHQAADQDALGSQFGLKIFLETNCINKKIYALGDDLGSAASLFPSIDSIDENKIKNSIAFVLDTGNAERIDDHRYQLADKIVKIDHHLIVEEYADVSYVDTSAAATCEILASLFEKSGAIITSECATYLYYGLLADSQSFTTMNTTSKTLQAGSFLVACGVDVVQVKADTMGMSEKEFLYINEVRSHSKVYGRVAYSVMNKEDYLKYGLSYNQAKEKVYALSNVNEYKIWCLFTQEEDAIAFYNGSLRSRKIAINEIASNYNGGGHKNACGVKHLTLQDILSLVQDMDALF